MKICKDCKHFKRSFLSSPRCGSPNIQLKINLVTGKKVREHEFCSTLRAFNNLCGADGEWFEEKK